MTDAHQDGAPAAGEDLFIGKQAAALGPEVAVEHVYAVVLNGVESLPYGFRAEVVEEHLIAWGTEHDDGGGVYGRHALQSEQILRLSIAGLQGIRAAEPLQERAHEALIRVSGEAAALGSAAFWALSTVVLKDVKEEFVQRGIKNVEASLGNLVQFHQGKAEREIDRIENDNGIRLTDDLRLEFDAGAGEALHEGQVEQPPLVARHDPARQEVDRRRAHLADAIVSSENRRFARTAVNRVWADMMGRGIVEPVDDVRVSPAGRYGRRLRFGVRLASPLPENEFQGDDVVHLSDSLGAEAGAKEGPDQLPLPFVHVPQGESPSLPGDEVPVQPLVVREGKADRRALIGGEGGEEGFWPVPRRHPHGLGGPAAGDGAVRFRRELSADRMERFDDLVRQRAGGHEIRSRREMPSCSICAAAALRFTG